MYSQLERGLGARAVAELLLVGRHGNMDMKVIDNERVLWLQAAPEQRSFLTEVLHWYRFRPAALKRSWAREEALTWELLRTLEILPQSVFLRPVLQHLRNISPETRSAIDPLLAGDRILVSRYPLLGLSGAKSKCRSDIGFGLASRCTVWIEAKTAPFRNVDLQAQLLQQKKALAKLFPELPTVVITLLPWNVTLSGTPNISWSSIAEQLEKCLLTFQIAIPNDYSSGYQLVATEMLGRIRSHPNRIIDNMVSPNNSLHLTHPRVPRSARRPAVRR